MFAGCLLILVGGGLLYVSTTDSQSGNDAGPVRKTSKTVSAGPAIGIREGTGHTGGHTLARAAGYRPRRLFDNPGCNPSGPPIAGLASTDSAELRKLAQYQQLCNGAMADRSSFFLATPTSATAAQSDAADVAGTLKEYASLGVKPLIFLEPDDDNGNNLDLVQYQAGAYDTALDSFFAALKADGVTDAMMGMWVALPEGNIPQWSSVDPNVFAADVTKTVQFQKKILPGQPGSDHARQ